MSGPRQDHRPRLASQLNPGTLSQPVLGFFLNLWNEQRGKRRMPARRDIRMSDVGAHAAHMVIVEPLADRSDFRFKLIGSAVAKYSFQGQTGQTVREAYAGAYEQFGKGVLDVYTTVSNMAVPLYVSVDDVAWIRDLRMNFAAIHMPLSSDGSEVEFVLSAMVSSFKS